MHLSKSMLNKPGTYRNDVNSKLIDASVDVYSTYTSNNWWPAGNTIYPLDIFTDKHVITIKREGVSINPLVEEPSYRYTEIDGVTFVENNGWWFPVKLFIGLEHANGELKGDPNYTNPLPIVQNLPWIKDCCFRAKGGYIEFWYTEADYPVKRVASRSRREINLCKLFQDKYGCRIEPLVDSEVNAQYGEVMRYQM